MKMALVELLHFLLMILIQLLSQIGLMTSNIFVRQLLLDPE